MPGNWKVGELPKNKALVWVKSKMKAEVDRGIGIYLDWDKQICGLSGEWDADPMVHEWQPVVIPEK